MKFRILSLNIHKGFSTHRRFILPELREAFRISSADYVFLQEVLGQHEQHAQEVEDWPDQSQTEFLADQVWSDHAYGKNAVYEEGHHGNAILSRHPIDESHNTDISSSSLERRGILYARIENADTPLHLICTHLSLMSRDRRSQFASIAQLIDEQVKPDHPLILAGDFNDWNLQAHRILAEPLGLKEAFREFRGRETKSFPSFFPFLRLDRIYYRNLKLIEAHCFSGRPWNWLSDHLPLTAEFEGLN